MRPLIPTLLLLAVATSSGAATRKSAAKPAKAAVAPAVPKVMQSCDAHKFETVVDVTVDGQPRKSKVKLCGVEGQSDAAWIETLRDAVKKLEANKAMPAAQREQIVTAIKGEIARLAIVEKPGGSPVAAPALQGRDTAPAQSSLSRDYAALPPLPSPVPGAVPTVPATQAPVSTQVSANGAPPSAPIAPVAPAIAKVPRLSFTCSAPSSLRSDEPCDEFERETSITVRAAGAVPPGVALRFVRNGEDRADVDLSSLASQTSMTVRLPREVCAGFGAGRLELQLVVNGSPSKAEGPSPLRCY